MKRVLSIILALVMALSLVACGDKTDDKCRYAPGREHREQDGHCDIEHRNGDEHTLDSGVYFSGFFAFFGL